MLNYQQYRYEEIGISVQLSAFAPEAKVGEFHAMLHVEPREDGFHGQLIRLQDGERRLLSQPELEGARIVMRRTFLSDAANQQAMMNGDGDEASSCIQQPPLDGSKISVWLYLQRGTEVTADHGFTLCRHNGYTHLWRMGMTAPSGDPAQQTEQLLTAYARQLEAFGAMMADNCVRTWFFVQDVDTQYAGMVAARRRVFDLHGLTRDTHYIASTGIGGRNGDPKAHIQFGAYALNGFQPGQQRYLYAPSHLNPTYEYGVTFERGVRMTYGDRAHVFVSGTASIDNHGRVVHEGDVRRQTQRMWDNVEALLSEAGATFADMMQIVVYLRDVADYAVVRQLFAEKFPGMPCIITLAPVCRPTWLIEMECIAVMPAKEKLYRAF